MATSTLTSQPELLVHDLGECPESTVEAIGDSLATGVMFALVLTVGQRLVGFLRGILFCRLMSDQQLGQWSITWSFLMLLAPLAMLGLPGCFGKYTEHYRQRGHLRTFVFRMGAVSLSLVGLLAVGLVAFPAFFGQLLYRDPSQTTLVQCLGIALLAVAVFNFTVSLMESLRQVRMVTMMRFISGIGFALVGTGLLVVWHDKAAAVTMAYALCCLAGLVPMIGWVRRWARKQNSSGGRPVVSTRLGHAQMWKRIAPFAIWLWVSNLLHNLFELSDRYMLLQWSDENASVAQGLVGQYHSGRVVPLLLVSVATMLGGILLPYMSAAWERDDQEGAIRQQNWTIKLIGVAFTFGGVLVLVGAPVLFDGILQGRYNEGLAVLPMTLVYCTWASLFIVGQDYLWVSEQGKMATAAVGLGLVGNIGLNMLLIPWMGLPGAVIATASGNGLTVLLLFAINHRYGCRADVGIWIVAAIPLLLLLPLELAALILLLVAGTCLRTDWIFNAVEKEQVTEAVRSALARIFS